MRSIPLAFLPARQILHPLGYYPLARNASLDLTCCVVYFLSQNGMLFFCGYASFARILTGYDRDSVLCLNDVMSFAPTRGPPQLFALLYNWLWVLEPNFPRIIGLCVFVGKYLERIHYCNRLDSAWSIVMWNHDCCQDDFRAKYPNKNSMWSGQSSLLLFLGLNSKYCCCGFQTPQNHPWKLDSSPNEL